LLNYEILIKVKNPHLQSNINRVKFC